MLLKLCVSLVLLHAVSCQDSGFEPPWGSEWSEAWSDRGCYRAPSNAALTSFGTYWFSLCYRYHKLTGHRQPTQAQILRDPDV